MADYELAKAYVQIIPTTKGIGAGLTQTLGAEGELGGEAGGKGIAAGLKKTLGLTGKVAAAGLAAATTGLVTFGKSAVGAGSDFDNAMSQVMATMGYSVEDLQTEGSIARQTLEKLRGFAQEQGATTAFSATQAAEALNYMALAGYDADKSMDMLPVVLDLAASGAMGLADASDMVTDAQSAFNLSTDETKTMVDQMAKTASKSNTSVSQLGEAYLKIGATARVLKGGTQELSTVLGVLADNGIKGTEGGTHLRNMLLSLQNPTDDGAMAMKQLGLEVYDSEGNMRSMFDIISDMQDAMKGMSDEQKTSYLTSMFNKTDLSAVNALLGTSKDRFEELGGAIGDASGAAKEMAKVQLDNLAGDVTLFKSALEGVQIVTSDKLTPTLREFVQLGTEGLGKIQKGLEKDGIAGAAEAFGDVIGDVVKKLADDTPELVDAGGKMLTAITVGFVESLPTFVAATPSLVETGVTMVTVVIGSITDVLPELATSLLKAVPGIIVVILSAIPDITTSICDAIPEIITEIILMLPGLFVDIAGAIIESFPKIVGAVFEGLGNILDGVGSFFVHILDGTMENRIKIEEEVAKENEALKAVVDGLSDIEPQMADYNTLVSSSGETLKELNGKIEGYESAITEIIRTALQEQGKLREEDLQSIEEYNQKILEAENQKMEIYRQQQKAQLQKLMLETGEIDRQNAEQHLANVTAALENANQATETAYEQRLATIENKYTAMGLVGSEAYQKELETAKKWHDDALAENQTYYNQAAAKLEENALQWVSTDAQKWYDLANNFERYRVDQQKSYERMNGDTRTYMRAADIEFAEALKEMDETATNGMLNMVASWKKEGKEINPATEAIVKSILDTFDGLPPELDDAGKDSLLGFIYGMEDEIPQLKDAANMSSQQIVDTIKKYLEINSPSRKMKGIGQNVVAGLRDGIKDSSSLVSASRGIGQQMVNGVQSGVESKEGALRSKINSMFSRIVKSAKANLQIASPSKVFENIGEMIGAGTQVGIEESSIEAIGAAEDMAAGISDAARDVLDTDYSAAYRTANDSLRANISAAAESGGEGRQMEDLLTIVRALYTRMDQLQIVLDTGMLVGGIKNQMDDAIGANGSYARRGMAV